MAKSVKTLRWPKCACGKQFHHKRAYLKNDCMHFPDILHKSYLGDAEQKILLYQPHLDTSKGRITACNPKGGHLGLNFVISWPYLEKYLFDFDALLNR